MFPLGLTFRASYTDDYLTVFDHGRDTSQSLHVRLRIPVDKNQVGQLSRCNQAEFVRIQMLRGLTGRHFENS